MKKRFLAVALAALTVGVMATGCQQKPEGAVAKVGEQVITEEEVNNYVDELKKYYGEEMFDESTEQGKQMIAEAKDNVTESLINQKVMEKIMEENKITVADADVDEAINGMKEQMGGEEEFNKILEAQGATIEQLKTQYLENLKANKYNEFITNKFKPTEEEIKKYFDQNKADFTEVNASHILIPFGGQDPAAAENPEAAAPAGGDEAENKKKAEETATKVLADAKKEGVDFGRLAKQWSQDPGTKEKGGELGYFIPVTMVEGFKNALKDMKPGEISGPIETEYGYHIIKVNSVENDLAKYQEETKEQVNQQITTKIVQEKSENLINQYRRDLGVKKY